LHKIIIKNLWPEVLMVPINPGRRTTILKITKVLGLLDIYNFLKDFRNNR
jgi:hypothetical protein